MFVLSSVDEMQFVPTDSGHEMEESELSPIVLSGNNLGMRLEENRICPDRLWCTYGRTVRCQGDLSDLGSTRMLQWRRG